MKLLKLTGAGSTCFAFPSRAFLQPEQIPLGRRGSSLMHFMPVIQSHFMLHTISHREDTLECVIPTLHLALDEICKPTQPRSSFYRMPTCQINWMKCDSSLDGSRPESALHWTYFGCMTSSFHTTCTWLCELHCELGLFSALSISALGAFCH